jgi:plastocyanin domain-containing protein
MLLLSAVVRRTAGAASFLAVLLAAGCRKEAPAAPPPAPPPAVTTYSPRVEVAITDAGFVPSRIPARAGKPLTLVLTRKSDRTCARDIVFQGQEGKTELPLDKPVEVTYTPKASGEVKFGCAMGMMVGGVLAVAD